MIEPIRPETQEVELRQAARTGCGRCAPRYGSAAASSASPCHLKPLSDHLPDGVISGRCAPPPMRRLRIAALAGHAVIIAVKRWPITRLAAHDWRSPGGTGLSAVGEVGVSALQAATGGHRRWRVCSAARGSAAVTVVLNFLLIVVTALRILAARVSQSRDGAKGQQHDHRQRC